MKKTCLITVVILMVLMSSVSYSVTPAGPLSVSGNRIVDQNDQPISFAGMSFFWTNDGWGGNKYYNADCLNWLVSDWGVTIVRAAMGVEDGGGYLDSPTNNKNRVITVVDASIAAGIYVIIDWHSHNAEDYESQAVAFFEEMATTYGGYDNVIYEIYNEPLSDCSWPNDIKPYAEAVIAAIRAIDPDNLIVVGSPEWSQRVDLPAGDPITGYINIAYTIHFYPDMGHTQWLRDRGTAAMNAGIALMATEWGPKGTPGHEETLAWMNWCELNYVSHTAWAVNDKDEPWSILDPWIGMETGGWTADDLSTRGQILKDICLNWVGTAPPPPEGVNIALNQPTACSSIENASYESAYAVDGSESTRWSSEFSDPQWIYVDLGGQKTVDSVRLIWEAAYATSYQIQVSDDASGWTDVYSTSSGDGGIDDIDLGGVVTRYVRMYGTQRATSYGYSLWEFEVYGTPPVILYQDYDYGGWSAGFGPGAYTMADIIAAGGVNDDASSLLIWPGYTVTLYEDDNFSGSSLVLTADTPNLGSYGFNDILSSMDVVKDTGVGVYQESGGVCTMEAENATVDQRSDNITWITATGHAGYIGSGYMTPPDNTGISVVWSTGCELAWDVEISTAGTYYMAVRRIALDNGDDSARVGVGGSERDDNTFNGEATSWQWSRGTDFDLGNLSVGTHTIQIRRREDGFCIDRVMIADSWSKLPADGSTEAGPAESPTGGEPPDTTPPAPPTGLAATAGDATVSLDWNDNNEPDFDVYDVYRSTSAGGPYSVIDFDLTSSDYIDNTVSNGTTYYYVVTAIDTSLNESGYSNEDSATPTDTTPPAAPAGLAATAGDSQVSLDWADNSEPDLDGYNIFRSTTPGGGYSKLNGSLVSSSDYTDNSVSNDTTYYYVVTAVDTSSNESGYSNEDSATPTDMTPPAAPTGLAAMAGDATVSLDWNDNGEGDLDGYNVYRSTTPGGGYSQLNGSLLSSSDYTDNSVSNGTTYYYVVTAVDTASNESGYSNEDSATPADATPPAAPTGLAATAGDATVSLDWDDNGESDLDGYNVYRSTTPGGGYSQLNGALLSSSDYTDNSVSNDTTYYYIVTAVDTSSNESGYSNEASATPTDTTPPAAPTGLAATAGDATVSLDWNDNGEGDLDGYNVYRSTTQGSGYSKLNGSLLSSSDYTDNNVSNGTTYYYVVTAVDTSSNESGYSGEVSATPQAGPSNAMHVADIAMSTKVAGKNVNGIATVTVVDAGGIPVEGATVSGHWSGLTSDSDSKITLADGTVSISSDKLKNPSGTFTFSVDNITKAGWTYDFAANVETSDSITVP